MDDERGKTRWAGLAVLLPIVCCGGLTLLLAAGLSFGLAALVGGLTLAGVALAVAVAVVALRVRRRRACRLD